MAQCPVTRQEFRDSAETKVVLLDGVEIRVPVKEFSTGSVGWYFSGKVDLAIGGVVCQCQVSVQAVINGSKQLPPLPLDAAA